MNIRRRKINHNNGLKINQKDIPSEVMFILKQLKKAGHLSFLVGGCVRDLLLLRTVRDWDVVTDAKPEQIQKIFNEHRTFLIGKSFLTVTLILNHNEYQISTIRSSQYYQGSQKRNKNSYRMVKDDLNKRDFTINAICWEQDEGLFDPCHGLNDLNNKIIRSINPDLRFKEDPLRMLRAVRLSCELSFTISSEVKKGIYKNAFLLRFISPERIKAEITFILNNPGAGQGLFLLCKFELDRYIFTLDGIKKNQIDKTEKNKLTFAGMKEEELIKDLSSKLALFGRLYYGSCKAANLFYLPVIKTLRFPKKIIKTVEILLNIEWEEVDFDNAVKTRFILSSFGEENTRRIILFKKALLLERNKKLQPEDLRAEENLLKEEIKKKLPLKISELAINGNDLIKMGLPEGRRIGEILAVILEKVIINPDINTKAKLLKLVQSTINNK
jgi:tRNA nucleotidyltransferase (CCA-adding enzyme)